MKLVAPMIYFDVMLHTRVHLHVAWKYLFKTIMFLIAAYKEVYLP